MVRVVRVWLGWGKAVPGRGGAGGALRFLTDKSHRACTHASAVPVVSSLKNEMTFRSRLRTGSYTVHLTSTTRQCSVAPSPIVSTHATHAAPGAPAPRAHRRTPTPTREQQQRPQAPGPAQRPPAEPRGPRGRSYDVRYFTRGLLTFINRTYAYCRGSGLQVAVARRWGSGPVYTSGPARLSRHDTDKV